MSTAQAWVLRTQQITNKINLNDSVQLYSGMMSNRIKKKHWQFYFLFLFPRVPLFPLPGYKLSCLPTSQTWCSILYNFPYNATTITRTLFVIILLFHFVREICRILAAACVRLHVDVWLTYIIQSRYGEKDI